MFPFRTKIDEGNHPTGTFDNTYVKNNTINTVNKTLCLTNIYCTQKDILNNSIKILVNNVVVEAILDTGAKLSCLRKDIYDKIPGEKITRPPKASLRTAAGHLLPIYFETTLPLVIEGDTLEQDFQIVDHLPIPCLIGMDYL